jgi:hypothetical protein
MRTWQAPLIIVSVLTPLLNAGIIMYGVNGGHGDSTPPNGDIVTVDQTTGAVTVLGASGFPRLGGIGILPDNTIYASTLGGGGFPPGPGFVTTSDLLKVALNGTVLSDVGTIHVASAAGPTLPLADLAVQPGTGTLYGISNDKTAPGGPAAGGLYTINPNTAIATLIGQTAYSFGSIAFAPDGTLYLVGATTVMGPPVNPQLAKVNPATGATVGTPVGLAAFYGAFGIRPTDSTLFVGNGDESQIFTLNPTTGAVTALSSTTGANFVGDLAFAVPEPGTFILVGLGIAAAAFARRRLLS